MHDNLISPATAQQTMTCGLKCLDIDENDILILFDTLPSIAEIFLATKDDIEHNCPVDDSVGPKIETFFSNKT
jgi:hypothetical protein